MKQLLAATLLLAALPLRADPPPQGSFMLGSAIWPDHVLPRSVRLAFEGEAMELHFVHPLPLDFEACDTTGICESTVQAATATARVDGGKLVLENIEIDESAAIEPSTMKYLEIPQDRIYTAFVISLLQQAGFAPTETGFTLTSAGTPMEFYAVSAEDALTIASIPVVFEQSIAQMGGCEVRALAPLLAKAEPTAGEARFIRVLGGFRTMLDYDFAARRAAPFKADLTDAQREEGDKLRSAAKLPAMIGNIFQTPEDGGIEEFRADMGLRMFWDDREALDAAIAAYGEALPDMVAWYRHLRGVGGRVDVATICADPSLGFME
ncbi:hypothetical protein [Vannielia sp. SX4]|uniref:hypothetical protein n=1 Tax=Vannielia sp. SX4 TaxID=3463852 RepID=UPI0040597DB0